MRVSPGGSEWQHGKPWEEKRGIEDRMQLFRQRRAKRVVLRVWRDAAAVGRIVEPGEAVEVGFVRPTSKRARRPRRHFASGGEGGRDAVVCAGGIIGDVDEFTVRREHGARLRTAEVRKTMTLY